MTSYPLNAEHISLELPWRLFNQEQTYKWVVALFYKSHKCFTQTADGSKIMQNTLMPCCYWILKVLNNQGGKIWRGPFCTIMLITSVYWVENYLLKLQRYIIIKIDNRKKDGLVDINERERGREGRIDKEIEIQNYLHHKFSSVGVKWHSTHKVLSEMPTGEQVLNEYKLLSPLLWCFIDVTMLLKWMKGRITTLNITQCSELWIKDIFL